jgi:hypothetical protein
MRVTATAWDALAPKIFDGLYFTFSIWAIESDSMKIQM